MKSIGLFCAILFCADIFTTVLSQFQDDEQPKVQKVASASPAYRSQPPTYNSPTPSYYSQKPSYYSQTPPSYYSQTPPSYYSQTPSYYSQTPSYYSQTPRPAYQKPNYNAGNYYGQPTPYHESPERNARILSSGYDFNPEDNSFQYNFETDNGLAAQARGYLKGENNFAIEGSYVTIDSEGKPSVITYVADENGFQPSGEGVPTPSPVIAKAVAYQKSLPASTESPRQYPYNPYYDYNNYYQKYGRYPQ